MHKRIHGYKGHSPRYTKTTTKQKIEPNSTKLTLEKRMAKTKQPQTPLINRGATKERKNKKQTKPRTPLKERINIAQSEINH